MNTCRFSLNIEMRLFCMKYFKELVSKFLFTYQRSNFIIIPCLETLGDFHRHSLIKTLPTVDDFHCHSHQNTNIISISNLNWIFVITFEVLIYHVFVYITIMVLVHINEIVLVYINTNIIYITIQRPWNGFSWSLFFHFVYIS